jgi:hypothetical protein
MRTIKAPLTRMQSQKIRGLIHGKGALRGSGSRQGGGAVVGTPCGAYERCLFGRASLIGETFE